MLIQWQHITGIYQANLSWTYPITFNSFHSALSCYSQAANSKWQGYSFDSNLTNANIHADGRNGNYMGSASFISIGI